MYLLPKCYRFVAPLCLALSGCAGAGWMSGHSPFHQAEAESKSGKSATAPRSDKSATTQETSEAATRVIAARPPALPAGMRDSATAKLVAELKAKGDLDARAATELEQALTESDPAIRDLLVQTLLAASRREDSVQREVPPRPAASLRSDRRSVPSAPQATISDDPVEEEVHHATLTSHETPVASDRTPPTNRTSSNSQREAYASRSPEEKPEEKPTTSPPATSSPVTKTPSPAAPLEPLHWKDSLAQAIEALEADLAANSSEPDDKARLAARLRLLYLAADRRPEAAQPIREQDEHRQEFWKAQLHALAVLLESKGPPGDDKRAALALRHVREAADHLAAASALDVRNLAFVSRVESYGRFTEFPKAHFHPDQEVLLYVEVDNFAVDAKTQGFETALEGSYQIVDSAGQRVADHTFPVEKETCRRPRRDFFIPYRLYMPKSAPPGDYILQLTIKDIKGDKFGQGSIRFTLEPGPAAAAAR